jgi:hypothetical protein
MDSLVMILVISSTYLISFQVLSKRMRDILEGADSKNQALADTGLKNKKSAKGPHSQEAFLQWLQQWQLKLAQGQQLPDEAKVPTYSFFSSMAIMALKQTRRFGSFPQETLWEWRRAVEKEGEFEKREKGLKNEAMVQFTLFSIMVWIFIGLSHELIQTHKSLLFLIVAILHVCGYGVFFLVNQFLKKHFLSPYPRLLETLYALKSLFSAGVPLNELIQNTNEKALPSHLITEKIKEVLKGLKSQGPMVLQQVPFLVSEVWFLREQALEKLQKVGKVAKFSVLLGFYGGSWFCAVYFLLRSLMNQM